MCRGELDKANTSTQDVVNALETLSACTEDQCKCAYFQESYLKELRQAVDNSELIAKLSFSMDYLSYHLMDHLAQRFALKMLQEQIQTYKGNIIDFCESMVLNMFCEIQNTKKLRLSPQFEEVVVKFALPGLRDVRLHRVLRQFRRDYCKNYKLKRFAMIFAHAKPPSVTWFVPKSVVEKLSVNRPHFLESYHIIKLKVARKTVYDSAYQVCNNYISACNDF